MTYRLNIRARPKPSQTVPARHAKIVEAARDLPAPWGLPATVPPAREPGTAPMTVVSLTRHLAKGLGGSLNYANRKHLPDEASADDWLTIDFDPRKVDYAGLIRAAFAGYVKVLGAYVGTVTDGQFALRTGAAKNKRFAVPYIAPVHFLDATLCARAFGLKPAAVAAALKPKVERATATARGVTVVVTSEALEFETMFKLCRPLRALLPPPRRA